MHTFDVVEVGLFGLRSEDGEAITPGVLDLGKDILGSTLRLETEN